MKTIESGAALERKQGESMASGPLISVVVPTYKRAHFLRRAIANIQRQTYSNVEIVVIDDASPDDTASVVEAIAEPRLRYIRHDRNQGPSAARNTGITAALGDYIAFMDDDDEWRKDKLEKQLEMMKHYDAVVCLGIMNGYPHRLHTRAQITLEDLKRGGFNPSSLLAKTPVLREVMFDERLRIGEDWDAFIRIAQRYSLGWVGEPLLIYNDGPHARATNNAKYLCGPELEKTAAVLEKHREFLGEKWFKFHLADTFLSYIGSKPNKFRSLSYAVKRCGPIPVAAALTDRVRRRVQRLMWTSVRS